MLGSHTHTRTHTHTHMLHTSPPCPPLSFLRFPSFFGLSLRLFRSFLRLVSLPQSRAKYSLFATPYSPALLALLFLFFFLSFLRLLGAYVRTAPRVSDRSFNFIA